MRAALANILTTLASLVVCGLALEAALRIHAGVPVLTTENLLLRQVELLRVQQMNEYDPLTAWVLKANFKSGAGDTSFTTGAHGIRMNQAEIRPVPEGAILAVGDSFTAGSEVGDAHSWPAHLERLLGHPVANGATGGWGADQIVLRAESLLDKIKPRIVVVDFLEDDISRVGWEVYGGASKTYFVVENGALVHKNVPAPPFSQDTSGLPWKVALLGRFQTVNFVMERLGRPEWFNDPRLTYRPVANDAVDVSCRLLARLRQTTAGRGVGMVFVMQYGGQMITTSAERSRNARGVLACARPLGFPVVDEWDTLKSLATTDIDAFKKLYVMHDNGRVFGHMSSEGNRHIAGLVAAAIESAGLLAGARAAAAPAH